MSIERAAATATLAAGTPGGGVRAVGFAPIRGRAALTRLLMNMTVNGPPLPGAVTATLPAPTVERADRAACTKPGVASKGIGPVVWPRSDRVKVPPAAPL